MVRAIDIWSGNDANLQQAYDTAISWFADRRAVPQSMLAKVRTPAYSPLIQASTPNLPQIACPVNVIHCFEDIGYPLENAEALVQHLQDAGVPDVHLHRVAGPHYGNVVSADRCEFLWGFGTVYEGLTLTLVSTTSSETPF
jgi:hypothetical protein